MKLILNITIPTEHTHLWENSDIPYTMLDYPNGTTAVSVNTDAITIPVQLIKESHATGYAAESFLSELTSTMVEFFTDGIFTDSDSFQISIDQFAHATCEDGVITVTLKNNGKLISDINTPNPDFEMDDDFDLTLPDELLLDEEIGSFSDLDELLLENETNDQQELTCKVLLYITILGQDYVLFKAESGSEKWYGTMPGNEYRRQQFKNVHSYSHCPDNSTGEAIRGRKLDTLYERYKATEDNADKAFARAFDEVYPVYKV